MVLSNSVRVLLRKTECSLRDDMAAGVELWGTVGWLVAPHLEGFVVGLTNEYLCSIDLSVSLVPFLLWTDFEVKALGRIRLADLL